MSFFFLSGGERGEEAQGPLFTTKQNKTILSLSGKQFPCCAVGIHVIDALWAALIQVS